MWLVKSTVCLVNQINFFTITNFPNWFGGWMLRLQVIRSLAAVMPPPLCRHLWTRAGQLGSHTSSSNSTSMLLCLSLGTVDWPSILQAPTQWSQEPSPHSQPRCIRWARYSFLNILDKPFPNYLNCVQGVTKPLSTCLGQVSCCVGQAGLPDNLPARQVKLIPRI